MPMPSENASEKINCNFSGSDFDEIVIFQAPTEATRNYGTGDGATYP